MNGSSTTVEIESILDKLSELCWSSVENKEPLDRETIYALVQSLSTYGWKRHNTDGAPLAVQVERRATRLGGEEIANHRTRLTANALEIDEAFDAVARFDTSTPDNLNQPDE